MGDRVLGINRPLVLRRATGLSWRELGHICPSWVVLYVYSPPPTEPRSSARPVAIHLSLGVSFSPPTPAAWRRL